MPLCHSATLPLAKMKLKITLDIGGRFGKIPVAVILGSSMAEHAAVNRRVVGSNPTRGAKKGALCALFAFWFDF